MAGKQPWLLVFDSQVKQHLRFIDRKHHTLILEQIEEQLEFEPDTPTRNRKRLRHEVLGARWELRFGPGNGFRAFYNVDADAHEVRIVAIGTKDRAQLFVAGEEVEL